MLKFVKHHMETILGIEIYPLISLVLFTLFFGVTIYLVIRKKREEIEEMKQLPLQDGSEASNANTPLL